MTRVDETSILRRKALQTGAAADSAVGADKFWRIVLARAARDAMALSVEVVKLHQSHLSLAELLDMQQDCALLAVLEGPKDGLGLMAISPTVLAAMTEMQTIGRVHTGMQAARRPTRTDAAMVLGFVDSALIGLEGALTEEADLVWAGGFRYASFLDDPRPLSLLLEDMTYRVMIAELSIEDGVRTGQILMALPCEGRGSRPSFAAHAVPEAALGRAFASDLAAQIEAANCVLDAVIHRIKQPVSAILALQVGDILQLGFASVDRIGFEGLNGQRLAEGRLGQNRGMRAVRLIPPVQALVEQIDVDVTELAVMKTVAVA